MDHELEVTREQMDETRASLTEKLETLENHVVHTVQDTADAVHETVADVKDAVHETVSEVKEMFDIPLQVQRRPWLMVGGAIALGYLGGYLLLRRGSDRPGVNDHRQPAAPANGAKTNGRHNGAVKANRLRENTSEKTPIKEGAQGSAKPGLLSGVGSRFGTEISKLEELAIGTAMSAFRDIITDSLPEQLKAEVGGVMDSVTVKLGGEPVAGPVFQMKNEE
jgi:ElaB/YqjD/DUF883 family membrane-anchored ribosome-binding protein